MACDFGFWWDLLFVPALLPFPAVVEDLFRDLVCALRVCVTCPFKNICIKLVDFVELVYRIFLCMVQGLAYISGVWFRFFGGL